MLVERTVSCVICGTEFRAKMPNAMYCSIYCRKKGCRNKLVEQGVCVVCGKRPARDGLKSCDVCGDKNLKLRIKREQLGIVGITCTNCGTATPSLGRKLCDRCRVMVGAQQKKIREKRRSGGLCAACGKNPTPDPKSYCEECRSKSRSYMHQHKLDAFDAYGGRVCRCCGETETIFLTLDHIDGGGNAHRRAVGRSEKDQRSVYRQLKAQGYPPGYQVLCFNCNFAKHVLGECPHQTKAKA